MNELASLWEKKIERELPRVTISEDDLLAAAKDMRIPESIVAALTHDIFIRGCQINYSMDNPNDVDVCSLYPDTPFRTIDDCFNDFVVKSVEVKKVVEEKMSKDAIIGPNSKPEALIITA